MRLSKNFTLDELIRSDTAKKKGVCRAIQPRRRRPSRISAGWLRTYYNRLGIGSVRALPLRLDTGATGLIRRWVALRPVSTVWDKLRTWSRRVMPSCSKALRLTPFDQLIWEFGDADQPAWVHVSYSERHRRQVLRAVKEGGKTVYRKWA